MYKLSTTATDKRTKHIIFCPNDNAGTSATPIVADNKNHIKFDKFAVPFYIGTESTNALTKVLNYVYSDPKGNPEIYDV